VAAIRLATLGAMPPPAPRPAQPAGLAAPLARLRAAILWLGRHRLLLALASFGAGIYSFVSMQRSQSLAQWLALLLGVGWLLMLLEVPLNRALTRFRWSHLSQPVLRYALQTLQQDTFFFCLPFLVYTTTWSSAQALFTAGVGVAALATMWDPVYYGVVVARPWLYFALHAFAAYVAALTVPPMVWQLTTTQSLELASLSIMVFALPSLVLRIERRHWAHWGLLLGLAMALGGLSWLLRFWVPPATLWVSRPAISATLDTDQRTPGKALHAVPASTLAAGLYAYTPIHAPRGLREHVFHVWRHDGVEVDRIPLTITGGRQQGYRAWSYKQAFPANPAGRWTVQVVTGADQLIGELRFRVTAAASPAAASSTAAAALAGVTVPAAGMSSAAPAPPSSQRGPATAATIAPPG